MWVSNFSANWSLGTAPTTLSTNSPFLRKTIVGIFLTPNSSINIINTWEFDFR